MCKTEINRFDEKINDECISMSTKEALCDVVEEFFSVNYENISEKRKREVELNFKLRRNLAGLIYDKSDVITIDEIFNQVENSLFTILDQSVNQKRKSYLEKLLSNLPSFSIFGKMK